MLYFEIDPVMKELQEELKRPGKKILGKYNYNSG